MDWLKDKEFTMNFFLTERRCLIKFLSVTCLVHTKMHNNIQDLVIRVVCKDFRSMSKSCIKRRQVAGSRKMLP